MTNSVYSENDKILESPVLLQSITQDVIVANIFCLFQILDRAKTELEFDFFVNSIVLWIAVIMNLGITL